MIAARAALAAKKPAPRTMEPGPIFSVDVREATTYRIRRHVTGYINRFLGGGLAASAFTGGDNEGDLKSALSFLRVKGAPYGLYFGLIIEAEGVQVWGWMCVTCEGTGAVPVPGDEGETAPCPGCVKQEAFA